MKSRRGRAPKIKKIRCGIQAGQPRDYPCSLIGDMIKAPRGGSLYYGANPFTLMANSDPPSQPPAAPAEVHSQLIPIRARASRLPNTFAALEHRNYQLYFGGQLVSVAGTWMQTTAQLWLVYKLSGSELMLGVVGFAAAIPALLVSPWGGVIVDRVPKRTLLVATQAAAMLLAFILAALAFTNTVQVWHIVVLAAGLGLVNAFDGPARQAFVVEMVGREDMVNAIALNSMMFNSARVIGPWLGGVTYAAFGAAWCFLLNGLSFLAVIGGLLMMTPALRPTAPLHISPWKQLTGGLGYVRSKPELIGLLLLALISSMFALSYSAVLPAFIDQVLHRGAQEFGNVNAATGLGAVTGALFIAHNGENSGKRGRWLLLASIGFPAVLLAFANNSGYLPALGLAYGLGLGFMIQFTLINTLLQTHVDDQLRGRVMSLYTVTFFGLAPFGNLAIGALSEAWGLGPTISASAGLALVFSAVVLVAIPAVRKLG